MKFVIYKDASGFYRWRLRAGNSEIIAIGEAYLSKDGAKHCIELIKKSAPYADVVDIT